MQRIGYKLLSLTLILMLLAPVVAQEEEGTTSALAGYTAGLNFGYPVLKGDYFKTEGAIGPSIGLVFNTPYGFAAGPFNMGVGGGIELANVGGEKDAIGIFGTINTTVYVTPYGPISVLGGVGLYNGVGLIGGVYFDYNVPNLPLVIKPYLRTTFFTSVELANGDKASSYFETFGIMALYDISTLF